MIVAADRIQVLPPVVAERIAAGEVIERPASVVKELVENSLDAGATEILVALENGGKDLIEVTDDGCGMSPADLGLCVRRHATSKLRSLDDLERILTLGFRGEALPSVAAVAELSLLSRPESDPDGEAYELLLGTLGGRAPGEPEPKPEPVTFGHFLNSPHGTRIQVRGLFAQVPARLKFLKAQGAEVSQVREWLERLALAHPRTGFRLLSDGRSVLNLRPQDEKARVRSLLAGSEGYPLVSAQSEPEPDAPTLDGAARVPGALSVRVHWIQGLSLPNSRRVLQMVNGRAVKDKLLQQALLMPFRQKLLPGQYPAVALYLEIDPAVLDVNIHPTKTEVKFLDSRKVFSAVQSRVEELIQSHGAPGMAPSRETWPAAESAGPGWLAAPAGASPAARVEVPSWASTPRYQPALPRFGAAPAHAARGPEESEAAFNGGGTAAAPGATAAGDPTAIPVEAVEAAAPRLGANGFPLLGPNEWVGILFNTYFAYDQGHELILIDQHAAHERVRYEQLRAKLLGAGGDDSSRRRLTPQPLLIPEAVRFAEEARAGMPEQLRRLEEVAFEVELFGEDTLLFRAVPAEWGTDDLRTRLKNLVERVAETAIAEAGATGSGAGALLVDETLFEALASQACHSAVRAGDRLHRDHALRLVADLERCENPWNCPHGRPTLVRVPRGRFEEWFQRRV